MLRMKPEVCSTNKSFYNSLNLRSSNCHAAVFDTKVEKTNVLKKSKTNTLIKIWETIKILTSALFNVMALCFSKNMQFRP